MFDKEKNFQVEKKEFISNYPYIYLKRRTELINLIREIIEELKFTDQTFYQSVLYLDILLYQQNEIVKNELNLITISSLILAGNFLIQLNLFLLFLLKNNYRDNLILSIPR